MVKKKSTNVNDTIADSTSTLITEQNQQFDNSEFNVGEDLSKFPASDINYNETVDNKTFEERYQGDNSHNDKIRRIAKNILKRMDITFNTSVHRVRDYVYNAKYAMQRARRSYDDFQLFELGFNEINLLSKKLRAFADSVHGYPAFYDDKKNWLIKHGNDWEKSIAPHHAMELYNEEHGVDIDEIAKPSSKGANLSKVLTVEDCGVEVCAWIEDLQYVADVFEEYDKYFNSKVETDYLIYGKEETKRRGDLIQEKFTEAWNWLGKMIPNLWD